ncbi:MAG: hypothetical protein IPJ20_23570 [Flammeovirgaceae bacterium]|nr:hypothetical protein [Flammeovirgaceae bacterium]
MEKVINDKSEIGQALSLYDKHLFWEYSEKEIEQLGPELVVPRVTRYGSLNDIIRLFVIFPVDVIYEVVKNDHELDVTEKTFYSMSASMNLHYNTVRPELLDLIKQICDDPFFKNYRLVGGTSLCLQIGHRESIVADFFSDGNGKPVPDLLKYIFQE